MTRFLSTSITALSPVRHVVDLAVQADGLPELDGLVLAVVWVDVRGVTQPDWQVDRGLQ